MPNLALLPAIQAEGTPDPYDAAAEIFHNAGFWSWQVAADSDVTARLRAAMRERESQGAA